MRLMQNAKAGECIKLFKLTESRLQHDTEFIELMLNQYNKTSGLPSGFIFPKELNDNKEVVLCPITHDGDSFKFASDRIKNMEDIAIAAITKY